MLREILQAYKFVHNLFMHFYQTKHRQKPDELTIVDATLGDGGYSYNLFFRALESQAVTRSKHLLYSFDWDKNAIDFVSFKYVTLIKGIYSCDVGCHTVDFKKGLELGPSRTPPWYVVHSNFAWIDAFFQQVPAKNVFFIVADLGMSTRQLKSGRGFSFKTNTKLDLRMSQDFLEPKGYDILNVLSLKELRDLFVNTVGFSKNVANYLAKLIIQERKQTPFGTQKDVKRIEYLAKKLVHRFPRTFAKKSHLHPSTLILMGLRIAVNSEYKNLRAFLERSYKLLAVPGAVVLVTFHSGERKIVEEFIRQNVSQFYIVKPRDSEIKENPYARSAKMYVLLK